MPVILSAVAASHSEAATEPKDLIPLAPRDKRIGILTVVPRVSQNSLSHRRRADRSLDPSTAAEEDRTTCPRSSKTSSRFLDFPSPATT
jgi:hypothetical protein